MHCPSAAKDSILMLGNVRVGPAPTPALILTYSARVPHPAEKKSGPMLARKPYTISSSTYDETT